MLILNTTDGQVRIEFDLDRRQIKLVAIDAPKTVAMLSGVLLEEKRPDGELSDLPDD